MKSYIVILFFPFIPINIVAQVNHVLNYSFESDSCADFGAHCLYSSLAGWFNPTDASPDWMNPCGYIYTNYEGEPQNYVGYQYPRSGTSYSGIGWDGSGNSYREYISGILTDTLNSNKKYCVTFYVSLADSLWWATSAIGAYFSDSTICVPSSLTLLPYTPQVENPLTNYLKDKINWVPISGEFHANGGEKFITIGNFYISNRLLFTPYI